MIVILSKPILNNPDSTENEKIGTRHTLVNILESMMRLLHPIIPFITEEIWQKLKPMVNNTSDSIMLAPFPIYDAGSVDEKVISDLTWIQNVITAIRNIRGELNISPSKPVNVLLKNWQSEDQRCLTSYDTFLSSLARLDSIRLTEESEETPPSSTALFNHLEVLVPVAGLIDVEAELSRLDKEISKLECEKKRLAGKLSNKKFVTNAPETIVAKEKEKLAAAEQSLEKLVQQKLELQSM